MKRFDEIIGKTETVTDVWAYCTHVEQDKWGVKIHVVSKQLTNIHLRIWNQNLTDQIRDLKNDYISFDYINEDYKPQYKSLTVNHLNSILMLGKEGEKLLSENKEFFQEIFMKVESLDFYDKILTLATENGCDKIKDIFEEHKTVLWEQPASSRFHHSYRGGLLRHTYQVLQTAIKIAEMYKNVNMQLLVYGAILHDIGKLFSYDDEGNITDKERLIGYHINGSQRIILRHFEEDYPFLDELLHIVVSHHGTKEWGSHVEPATKEAYIIFTSDYLSSHLDSEYYE